jgi:hypothetical protein
MKRAKERYWLYIKENSSQLDFLYPWEDSDDSKFEKMTGDIVFRLFC